MFVSIFPSMSTLISNNFNTNPGRTRHHHQHYHHHNNGYGHHGLHPYSLMFHPRHLGIAGGGMPHMGGGGLNSRQNALAAQKQQLFASNAWRLFVMVLLNQANQYHQLSALDGAFLEIIGFADQCQAIVAKQWFARYSERETVR